MTKNRPASIIDLSTARNHHKSTRDFDFVSAFFGILGVTAIIFSLLSLLRGEIDAAFIYITGYLVVALIGVFCGDRVETLERDLRDLIDNEENRRKRAEFGKARYDYLRTVESFLYRNGAIATGTGGAALAAMTGTSLPFHLARAGAAGLRNRAKRHEAISGSELQSKDPRAPVLYLRSFDDERWIGGESNRWNLEQIVVEDGSLVGPVIAIGRPGEGLPPLGAARDYVSDDDWQEHARNWINESAAILLVLGPTEGLAWEIVRIERDDAIKKSIFILPPLSDVELVRRWDILLNRLDSVSPKLSQSFKRVDPTKCNAIVVDEEIRAKGVWAGGRDATACEIALTHALGLVSNAEERTPLRNVDVPPPIPSKRQAFGNFALVLAVLLLFIGLLRVAVFMLWEQPQTWKIELQEALVETAYETGVRRAYSSYLSSEKLKLEAQELRDHPEIVLKEFEKLKKLSLGYSAELRQELLKFGIERLSRKPEDLLRDVEAKLKLPQDLADRDPGDSELRGWRDGESKIDNPYFLGYNEGFHRRKAFLTGRSFKSIAKEGVAKYAQDVVLSARARSEKLYPASTKDAGDWFRGYTQSAVPYDALEVFLDDRDWR